MRTARHDLTYCSNIHAGETWNDVSGALKSSLPCLRHRLQHAGPLAIGLRLSASAAQTLEVPACLEEFRTFLARGNYYVPTINGFPYGAFHGTRVKERVYEPDWRTADRVGYTNRLARILAGLNASAPDRPLSISTVPGAFRPLVRNSEDAAAVAQGMLRTAAFLRRLHDESGIQIVLAIEPEPACFIETIAEAITFFDEHLFDPAALRAVADIEGVLLSVADVSAHIGLCLDTCHMAVEFEDPVVAIKQVRAAGLRIAKVQLSSALRVAVNSGGSSPQALLAPFAEDTYLHQVVISSDNQLHRFTDLPDALRPDAAVPTGEWRVHFHVPIFLETMSGFSTTQGYISRVLRVLQEEQVSTCLEVETYTWDVLPSEYRTTDVCTAIARELEWVRAQLRM